MKQNADLYDESRERAIANRAATLCNTMIAAGYTLITSDGVDHKLDDTPFIVVHLMDAQRNPITVFVD